MDVGTRADSGSDVTRWNHHLTLCPCPPCSRVWTGNNSITCAVGPLPHLTSRWGLVTQQGLETGVCTSPALLHLRKEGDRVGCEGQKGNPPGKKM